MSVVTAPDWTRGPLLRPVRRAGKASVRGFGVVTSPVRTLPDFLVIGTKRGGTTSMYNYLLSHPAVVPLFPAAAKIKGVHFFDRKFRKGAPWYRSHFPTIFARARAARRRRAFSAGEASPYYLFHPRAPHRARRLVPAAKVIILLRNPVDRAYSHYKERRRNGSEPLPFEEALAREDERLQGEVERILADPTYHSIAHEHHSYVTQGIYLPQLQAWMDLYPTEQVLVLRSEDLFDDPADVYQQTLRFLDLPTWRPRRFERFNYRASEGMPPAIKDRLATFFEPHNRQLEEFLGRPLHWS